MLHRSAVSKGSNYYVWSAKEIWYKHKSFRRKLVIAMKNVNKLVSKYIDRILTCLPDRLAE
ncbi:MAG: hypothetical protein DRQ13_09955 [Ignavibacteriae bacterium]|nr:MAG: hypothetical protein DRQ13_09955 [Ignavibacteriota bacterium]